MIVWKQRARERIVKCPICEKATTWKDNPYRPFCSERCKIIDLARWASEDYRISAPLKDTSEEAEQQDEPQARIERLDNQ
jgi:endogenous inhibitor of DNA gyrase (YacG/DUF329 family)